MKRYIIDFTLTTHYCVEVLAENKKDAWKRICEGDDRVNFQISEFLNDLQPRDCDIKFDKRTLEEFDNGDA